ncbi:MAG TPA: hypothetical protein VGF99_12815 [Myxococcota bacterium]
MLEVVGRLRHSTVAWSVGSDVSLSRLPFMGRRDVGATLSQRGTPRAGGFSALDTRDNKNSAAARDS